jgi:hypothetical protein
MSTVPYIYAHAEAPKQTAIKKALNIALVAYKRHYDKVLTRYAGKNGAEAMAHHQASISYRLAMPQMDSWEGIHANIACVAQGIAMRIYTGRDGSQLLYAAQVAISVLEHQQKEARQ